MNNSFETPKQAFTNPKKQHFDKIALIDADKLKHLIAYDIYSDLKNNIPRSDHRRTMFIEERLNEIFSNFSALAYIFCFSGKSNNTFRAHIAVEKEYKGSRKDDPTYYEGKIEDMAELVRVVMKTHPTLLFNNLEADDILCFLQCEHTFIYSNDKDLKQIPGLHFDFGKKELYHIDEEEAFTNLCYQMLIGDSTDCIPGLPGVGPKKAKDIINSVPVKLLLNRILFEYQIKMGITLGTDCFTETWNLVKLRPNRGAYFKDKYKEAFNLLNIIIANTIK